MKRKVLSILLALAMCLALLPTTALATETTVKTAEALTTAVASGGTVKLADDIDLSDPLTITGTVTLDLNGKTLSGKNGSDGGNGDNAIIVSSGSLTIIGNGSIVGGNGGKGKFDGNGGSGGTAITVAGGSLTISGNSTINGGNGGNGGDSLSTGRSGGAGGDGLSATGGSVTMSGGTIKGGNGGNASDSSSSIGGAAGGNGGNGLSVTGGSVNIGGEIIGGSGGNGGKGAYGYEDGSDGAAGTAISLSGATSIGVSSAAALKTAVEAGVSNIRLANDITIDSTLTIAAGKTVTLDLNGHVLQYKNSTTNGGVIKVAGGNLTLKDSNSTGTTHYFTVDDTGLWSLCTATGCSHEHKTVKGGIITGGTGTPVAAVRSGGGVCVTNDSFATTNGSFTMTGGSIVGCTAIQGGGVHIAVGSFTMTGGSIVGCTSLTGAGVCITVRDYMNANGGTINGDVYNSGTITRTATGDINTYTTFNGTVANSNNGKIEDAAKLTVTFDLNGGTGDAPAAQKILKGQKATAPTAPTAPDGYTFSGWLQKVMVAAGNQYIGSSGTWESDSYLTTYELYDFSEAVTDNITLYAQFVLNTYAVTYNAGQYGEGAVAAGTKTHGADFTLSGETFTRSGYTQTGWATGDGGEKVYDLGGSYTDNAAVTLYPVWTKNSTPRPSYAITVSDADNGSVTAGAKSAKRGATVTLTIAPDKGYTLETLTVLDQNGNEIELTDKGDGTYTFAMPRSAVTVRATFMEDNTMLNFFVDVPADAYYYDAVLWAAQNGIAGGVDETHFAPDLTCTRAELATLLYRYAQAQDKGFTGAWMFRLPFTDVPQWCYEGVAWCYMNDVMKGYGGELFGALDTVTREQVATILYRFAQTMGMDTTQGGMLVREFSDYESISDYAVSAMQWAVNAGIMQGNDGKLMPRDSCDRAQIVTMLYRLLGE